MTDRKPPRCLDMALQFGERGYPIFPAPVGTKRSHKSKLFSGGINWGASSKRAQIIQDFLKWPDANIGLPTGNFNGLTKKGFFVIDCDTIAGHGVDGIAGLAALEAKHGKLPPTSMAISPTGSVHYYFKSPAGIKIKGSESEIARGVDVCGDGQMVIVPPSIARVAKGSKVFGQYSWLNKLPMADAPKWLIDLCKKRKSKERDDDDVNEIDIDNVIDALDAATNNNVDEEKWYRLIASAHAGSGGAPEALAAFQRWSKKSPKHDASRNKDRWEAFDDDPPVEIGVGTLYAHANETAPGWREAAAEAASEIMMKAYAAVIKAKYGKGGRHNG